jgi:uncharacterized protein
MPKQLIKRITPDHTTVRNHKYLRLFGRLLLDPNLWHLNRRSVSGGFFVGLFWAFFPMPFQMVAATATAIPARVNLPIAVALVWITNPITIPPIFFATYKLGCWILGQPGVSADFQPTLQWFSDSLGQIWLPLYLGSVICGLLFGLLGFVGIRLLWRLRIANYLKGRRARRLQRLPGAG